MATIRPTLWRSCRAALVVLALGAGSVTAMPAMAQSPNFSFQFGIDGGGGNFSFGIGKRGERFRRDCLSNNEIRRGLRREGFDDIRFLDRRGRTVDVIAEQRRWVYRLRVNRCTGAVRILDRDRRGGNRPGTGLHFRF
jgi:hypothetical protein